MFGPLYIYTYIYIYIYIYYIYAVAGHWQSSLQCKYIPILLSDLDFNIHVYLLAVCISDHSHKNILEIEYY